MGQGTTKMDLECFVKLLEHQLIQQSEGAFLFNQATNKDQRFFCSTRSIGGIYLLSKHAVEAQ